MKISVLTLFPDIFGCFLSESIIGRAQKAGIADIELINFRAFSTNKHMQVDDSPYGGGAGMVLSVEPIYRALVNIDGYEKALKILLTPQGETYNQTKAIELSSYEHLILICGHYEGFDERIRDLVDMEISVGDYVLTGGEVPAMILIDSIVRLLPGALGKEESYRDDSFFTGLLEYPQYTRPYDFMGQFVPEVLVSGNHAEIEKWRREQALKRTLERRPDLVKKPNKKD